MKVRSKVSTITNAAAAFGCAAFGLGVALFAYAGSYSRYWADDYCYSATVKQSGLFKGLVEWYISSGNRLSTLVVVSFTDLFGQLAIRLVPLAVLVFWVVAWVFFLWQSCRALGWKISPVWIALLSFIQVFFAALLAPDRLQTIYWRVGTFHYTLPMPILLVNLGIVIAFRHSKGWQAAGLSLLSGFIGFFAAGLSETFAALQTGLFSLAILSLLILLRGPRYQQARSRGIWLLAPPLAGSLLMMVVMILAPANSWRQAVLPPPSNLLLILPYTLRYTIDFIHYTLRGQPLPFLVYMLLMGIVTLLVVPSLRSLSRSGLFAGVGISLLGMVALIFCSFAPSAYAGLAYPAGRALMPGGLILLAGLGAAAAFFCLAMRDIVPVQRQGWLAAGLVILLVGASFYPLRSLPLVRHDIAQLAPRAARWDARNSQILASIRQGNLDVRVKQVDVVQTLEDMGPASSNWINACASVFYGARSITANP